MSDSIHFRCPCCHGSQYRTSSFDVTEKNPFGAKCIFCKSAMITADNIYTWQRPVSVSTITEIRK
ncbi:cold shock small protein YmcF [Scandinavium manionii]|uniref:cold shock small protein YmcF n=1 Tax=Scandinavium manionii TaxID=2926520 RepID=UPI0021660883|nr:cold-shock protein [Scandinavium manionii]MCS2147789.1 cold-shock protein [Scandinavium manionii]